MSLPSWIAALHARPSVVTIGKFDGVHLGHRVILEQAKELASERGLDVVVVTFDRHPLQLLRPDIAPSLLLSPAQQREALHDAGIDHIVTIPFDAETAAIAPETFVETVLLDGLGAEVVIVGADFRYGAKGAGDAALLRDIAQKRGVEVQVIDDVCSVDGTRISSTWIRDLLELGRITEAREMLGRPPTVRGTVVPGQARGRELGFPTANLGDGIEGFVPADGVYAAWASVDAGTFMAAVSIGNNPTFAGQQAKTVEAYLLDVDLDLYGQRITLELVEFLRPMHRFDGVESLIAQMHRDVGETRKLLADAGTSEVATASGA